MEKDLIAIKQHLSSIENLIDEIERTHLTERKQEDMEIDIQKIDKIAKQCPFRGHFISDYDEDIIKKYIIFLASVIREAKPVEKKIKQYFFVARIINGCNLTMPIEEWVTKSELVDLSEIEFIREELKDNLTLLAFDVFLMISLDGEIADEQLNYYCELLAYLSLDKKKIQDISCACACVLKEDDYALFQYAGGIHISKLSCYLKGKVFTSLAEANNTQNTEVIIVGEKFKNTQLELDAYKKRSIRFIKCQFENVASIQATKTEVMFESCYFSDCVRRCENKLKIGERTSVLSNKDLIDYIRLSAVFIFNKVMFRECKFEKCGQSDNLRDGGFISCNTGDFFSCSFINCFVNINSMCILKKSGAKLYEYAALLMGNQLSITDCFFYGCVIYGHGWAEFENPDCQFLNLVYCSRGSVKGTKFVDCSISGLSDNDTKKHNYLLNTIDAMINDNSYSNCKCQKNEGSAEWKI